MNASKFMILVAMVIFIIVAAIAYFGDTPNLVHLLAGLAAGLAVWAAAALVP